MRPTAHSLFFASPKKSKQNKGEPDSSPLRFAAGKLRCSGRATSRSNSLRSDSRTP